MVPFFLQRLISSATHVPVDFFLFPPIFASLFLWFIVHWEKTKQRKMSVWGAKLPTVSYFFVSLGLIVKERFSLHKTFLRQHFDLYRRFPTPRVTFPKTRYRSQRIFFSSYHVFFRIGISLSFFSQYHKVKQWVGIMSAPRAQEDFWRRPKTDQGRKTECLGTRGSHKMPKKFPFNQ